MNLCRASGNCSYHEYDPRNSITLFLVECVRHSTGPEAQNGIRNSDPPVTDQCAASITDDLLLMDLRNQSRRLRNALPCSQHERTIEVVAIAYVSESSS